MNSLKLVVILQYWCCIFTVTFSLNSCLDKLIVSQQNVISVNNVLVALTNLSRVECISTCAFHQNCMAMFYRVTTHDCILYSQNVDDLALIDVVGWRGFGVGTLGDPSRIPASPESIITQWVQSVGDFSSEYNEAGYRAVEIIGPYDVYPSYGDLEGSFTAGNYQGPEWIEVVFAVPVFISRVEIYETFMAGGVESVEVKRPDGSWEEVWTTPQLQKIEDSRVEVVDLQMSYVSNQVKITIDGTVAGDYPELDAVQVSGWPSWTLP